MNYRYLCGHCGRESASHDHDERGLVCPYCRNESLVHVRITSDTFEFGAVVGFGIGFIVGRIVVLHEEADVRMLFSFGLALVGAYIGGVIQRRMVR